MSAPLLVASVVFTRACGEQVSGSALDKNEYFKIYGEMLKMLDGQDALPDTYLDFFFERSVLCRQLRERLWANLLARTGGQRTRHRE